MEHNFFRHNVRLDRRRDGISYFGFGQHRRDNSDMARPTYKERSDNRHKWNP